MLHIGLLIFVGVTNHAKIWMDFLSNGNFGEFQANLQTRFEQRSKNYAIFMALDALFKGVQKIFHSTKYISDDQVNVDLMQQIDKFNKSVSPLSKEKEIVYSCIPNMMDSTEMPGLYRSKEKFCLIYKDCVSNCKHVFTTLNFL